MKYFYTHLIEIESLTLSLNELDLSKEEKLHLAQLIDSSLHHTILDVIFSQLSDSDKRVFVQHLTEGNHDKIWNFLQGKVTGVEEKIKKAAEDLKEQLHEDLKKAAKESKK